MSLQAQAPVVRGNDLARTLPALWTEIFQAKGEKFHKNQKQRDTQSAICMSEVRIADESKDPIKFVAVDDDECDRLMTSRTLEKFGEVRCVGLHGSADEALKLIPLSRPRIVFMDIRMPRMSGIECARELKERIPELLVIFMTGAIDSETAMAAARAGGDDYLVKPLEISQCLATIRFAVQRRRRIGANAQTSATRQLPQLNHRESEVMDGIATGLRNKEIAAKFNWSVPLVQKIVRGIYGKLAVTNRAESIGCWRLRDGQQFRG